MHADFWSLLFGMILKKYKLGEDGEAAGADDDESLSDWNLRKFSHTYLCMCACVCVCVRVCVCYIPGNSIKWRSFTEVKA